MRKNLHGPQRSDVHTWHLEERRLSGVERCGLECLSVPEIRFDMIVRRKPRYSQHPSRSCLVSVSNPLVPIDT